MKKIKDSLLLKFNSSDKDDIEIANEKSYILSRALNYLLLIIEKDIDEVKLAYLNMINFENLEEDKQIIDFIDDKFEDEFFKINPSTGISDDNLISLYKKLRPIVNKDGKKFIIKDFNLDELKTRNYIMDFDDKDLQEVNLENAQTIGEFKCYHSHIKGHFNPNVKEILSQAPSSLIKEANAFEIVSVPKNILEFISFENKIFESQEYYMTKVKLYKIGKNVKRYL